MSKVLYEKRDRIAYVTINRPEARNAIDPDVHRLMIETWADFRDDDSVDVAILTGAGRGVLRRRRPQDLHPADHRPTRRPREIREIVELGLNGFTRGMHRISKPIIGAVNGWALAGGLETALACDIRIASERAMFGSFEARRGFHHGDGGTRAPGQHLRRRRRDADAAHGGADRRPAGAAVQHGHEGRPARRPDGRGRAGRPARSCATPRPPCARPSRRSST